jgi:Tol biopolymer transport system component
MKIHRLMAGVAATVCIVAGAGSASAQQVTGYELALVDTRGNKEVLGRLPPSVYAPRISPDGTKVVFEMADSQPAADGTTPTRLWIAELENLEKRRALPMVGTERNMAGVWTPDGSRIVFMVSATGQPDALYWRNADGSGEAEKLLDARAPEDVYANGTQLSYLVLNGEKDYGIWSFDLGTRMGTRLVDGKDSEQHSSRISPDGKWLAYVSDDLGKYEISLEPLPQTGKRYRISPEGGRHPMWSADGLKMYFDLNGQMFRMDLFLDDNPPQAGAPEALPIKGFQQGDLRRQFDLMPDAPRFLMLFPLTSAP